MQSATGAANEGRAPQYGPPRNPVMQIPDTDVTTRAELSDLIRSIKAAIAA